MGTETDEQEWFDASQLVSGLPELGSLLDDTYRIQSVIGRGGMGVVLLATDEKLQREVAIKVIAAEGLLRPDSRERFMVEARAMAGVRHENVVRIYALGEYETAPYFVMEYLPGANVADWLNRYFDPDAEHPAVDEILGILDQVCRGLSAIHEADIVHADVKPGNVLLGPAHRAALTDFGLVRVLGSRDSAELIVGTPSYIPPEVVYSTNPIYDQRSDVYALGVMAYEMFTGRLPFDIENVNELFDVHQRRVEALPASEIRADLPATYDDVLARAIDRDVHTRWQTVDAFRKALIAARSETRSPQLRFRFVVADDDEDFLELARETLDYAFPGANIICVQDGEAALQVLDEAPAALAIIDLDMPGMNGIELTAAIRARDSDQRMPIVVATATGGAPDWRLLQSLGADGFLIKPLDPYALVAAARRAVGATMMPPKK